MPSPQPSSSRGALAVVVALAVLAGGWALVRDGRRHDTGSPSTQALTRADAALPGAAAGPLHTVPLQTVALQAVTPATTPATIAGTVTTAVDTLAIPAVPTVALIDGAPAVDASSYLVYDAASNTIIAAKAADTPRPVASIIKLLTAAVVLHAGPLDDPVTVPPMKVDMKESQIGLRAGEQLNRGILTRAMLIVSANDAARALAIDVAGSDEAFVEQMNQVAADIGLADTVAKNPIGLDQQGAHSTAADVLTLARYVMQDESIRKAVARDSARLHGNVYRATYKLLGKVDGVNGVKTGHTTGAGYSIVASAERDGREIYVVVLGAASDKARTATTRALLDWAFDQQVG